MSEVANAVVIGLLIAGCALFTVGQEHWTCFAYLVAFIVRDMDLRRQLREAR